MKKLIYLLLISLFSLSAAADIHYQVDGVNFFLNENGYTIVTVNDDGEEETKRYHWRKTSYSAVFSGMAIIGNEIRTTEYADCFVYSKKKKQTFILSLNLTRKERTVFCDKEIKIYSYRDSEFAPLMKRKLKKPRKLDPKELEKMRKAAREASSRGPDTIISIDTLDEEGLTKILKRL